MLLRSDGTAVAFGLNSSGVNDIPQLPGGATYVDVFSGGATTFLLTAANSIPGGDSARITTRNAIPRQKDADALAQF